MILVEHEILTFLDWDLISVYWVFWKGKRM